MYTISKTLSNVYQNQAPTQFTIHKIPYFPQYLMSERNNEKNSVKFLIVQLLHAPGKKNSKKQEINLNLK